jgi:hypothetical protein
MSEAMKGSIDILTSGSRISDRPIFEYIKGAVEGKLPDLLLPTFLHESAHHWCLSGSVGTALSLKIMELHRKWLESPIVLDPTSMLLQSRVSSVQRILEPLLEGMALFADFDLYPGRSEVASEVLCWATYLFTQDINEFPVEESIARIKYLLTAYRCSELAIRRKSDILVRPLDAATGGYLLGYLTVKNLWHEARKASKRLQDADLFFTYLRNYIFEDCELVEMLLSEPMEEYADMNRLLAHVHGRLKGLRKPDLDDRVESLEGAIVEGRSLEGHWESIYLDGQRVAVTKKLLADLLHEITKSLVEGRPDLNEAFRDITALFHRKLFIRICVDDVRVRVHGDGRCTVTYHDQPMFTAPTFAGVAEGEDAGLLALYFLTDPFAPVLICIWKTQAVCSFVPDHVPENIRNIATTTIPQVLLAERLRSAITSNLFMTDFENLHLEGFESFLPKLTPTVTKLFLNYALCFVADAQLGLCLDRMRTHGFWHLLSKNADPPGKTGDRIRAMAALGLVASCGPPDDIISEILGTNGIDLQQALSDMAESYRHYGYSIVGTEVVKTAGSPQRKGITSFV